MFYVVFTCPAAYTYVPYQIRLVSFVGFSFSTGILCMLSAVHGSCNTWSCTSTYGDMYTCTSTYSTPVHLFFA